MPSRDRLLIGCPILRREWIIEQWLEHVLVAASKTGKELSLLFVGDESDPTVTLINEFTRDNGIVAFLSPVSETRDFDRRDWGHGRYDTMVALRNQLLREVRKLGPELFLSLDSDILLHEAGIVSMIEALEGNKFDAVGGKAYMTPAGTRAPSYAMLSNTGNLRRPEASGIMKVNVIMAIKLMTPAAYMVDYQFDVHGEDIGWSRACTKAGLTLGWDGRIVNKHVMNPSMLTTVDKRAGF